LEKQKEAELAAKKAAEKLAAQSQPPPPAKDRVPNGMVRITHNPLTNSAVITPLYGPLEPNGLGPSYLQQSVGNIPNSGKMASTSSSQGEPPKKANQAPIPSKPPNPPVLQPASVSSSLANNSITNPSQPQQMVTIRRVMQPNLTEPMVTVTLKGETPDNDRVLFTLVNGQVLPTSGGPAQSQKQSNSIPKSGTTTTPTTVLSNRKLKKQEKKKQKKLLRATSNNEEFVELPQPPREPVRRNFCVPCYILAININYCLNNRFVSVLLLKPILQLKTFLLITFDYLLALHLRESKALTLPLIQIYPCEWSPVARKMQLTTRQSARIYLAPIQ